MCFLLFKIFEQLALALKNRVALEFFTVLKYILLFRIFEELADALKTEFSLKFFKPGGAPAPPRLVRLWAFARVFNKKIGLRQNTFFPNLLSFSGMCLGSIAGLNFACLFGLNLIALTVACYITAFHTFFMWPLERTWLNNQRQ